MYKWHIATHHLWCNYTSKALYMSDEKAFRANLPHQKKFIQPVCLHSTSLPHFSPTKWGSIGGSTKISAVEWSNKQTLQKKVF